MLWFIKQNSIVIGKNPVSILVLKLISFDISEFTLPRFLKWNGNLHHFPPSSKGSNFYRD